MKFFKICLVCGKDFICYFAKTKNCSMECRKAFPKNRFYKNVKIAPGCWKWRGPKDKAGYGIFWLDGRSIRAHRAAWILIFGPIKKGLFVLHSCDNPNCVNIEHLRLGTHIDNMNDKKIRGRAIQRFFKKDILEMKRLFKEGWSQKAIASQFKTNSPYVNLLINHKLEERSL